MSTDFRPTRIATLATTDNSLAGIRAIRNAAALTYKFARTVLNVIARGTDIEVPCGGGVSANVDRQNATPTLFVGDSTNGTDGTAAFAVASLNLKAHVQARQLFGGIVTVTAGAAGTGYTAGDILSVVQTGGTSGRVRVLSIVAETGAVATFNVENAGGGYTVANGKAVTGGSGASATFNITVVDRTLAANLTYASGYALASSELYKVKVDGTLKTVTTDYTVSSTSIVFVATKEPANGATVEIFALSNPTALTNEVVVVTVAGVVKAAGGSDYTLSGGTVTFAAGHVPTAGQEIRIFFRIPGTYVFTFTAAPVDHGVSAAAALIVYVDDVEATITDDYVITAATTEPVALGFITFDPTALPAAAAVVRLAWTYAIEDTFIVPGVAAADDAAALEVWVGDTKKTATTDYVITGRTIVFVADHEPAADAVVKAIAVSAYSGIIPAGFVTFFDSQRLNNPAWDFIRASSSAVVEVM